MKKSLLLSSFVLIGACVVNVQGQNARPLLPNKAVPILRTLPMNDSNFPSSTATPKPITHKGNSVLASTLVGYTCYELQSNSAAPRNIINYADGTLSFAWTIDDACASGNANRGSGYNHWNGSALVVPGGATIRVETTRTGFSQIAVLPSGVETIFAHNGVPYDFKQSKNTGKGSNTWTGITAGATTILANQGVNQGLWGRIATGGSDGNSIHLLAGYFDGVANGITTPTAYSRSLDGGASWFDQSVMLPGYDSTRTYNGSGEAYAIDAEGATVAIVYGGLDADVILWKSTDNGATFTRTSVDSYAFEPSIDSTGTATDTAQTNDGAVTVVLGSTGTTHVAYSTGLVIVGGFFPTEAGLIYWNDVAKAKVNIPVTLADIDAVANGGNGTNAWEVGQYTSNINPSGASTPPSARYGNRSFLTIPSIAVDGNNVFILFSLVSDGDSTVDGQSFRDLWIVASADGGTTFGKIQNITCTQGEEEFFSSLAKKVDANLHFLYDLDTEPGTNIQNGDPIAASEMRYGKVDKTLVLAGTASCGAQSVYEHNNNVFSIANSYPNPATGLTFFDITMKQNASVTLQIVNSLGQQVYSSSENLSAGRRTLSVDAGNFSNGLYFYTIKSGDAVATGKMTVSK